MATGYRPKSSYQSRDPEKRAGSLSNLRQGRQQDRKLHVDAQERAKFDPFIAQDIVSWLEVYYIHS